MYRVFVFLLFVFSLLGGCKDIKEKPEWVAYHYFDDEPDRIPDAAVDSGIPTGDPCEGEIPWACNPLSTSDCQESTSACDYGQPDGIPGFYCFTDSTAKEDSPCDPDAGPWCAAGLTCQKGFCARYCCSDGDCLRSLCQPPVGWEIAVGKLGICAD